MKIAVGWSWCNDCFLDAAWTNSPRISTFGMPALEAMASGYPVITSDIPRLVKVLGGAGLHFACGSAEDLAQAMRRLIDSESLADELRQGGVERAKFFSWDTTAKITAEVYREAAKIGPRF